MKFASIAVVALAQGAVALPFLDTIYGWGRHQLSRGHRDRRHHRYNDLVELGDVELVGGGKCLDFTRMCGPPHALHCPPGFRPEPLGRMMMRSCYACCQDDRKDEVEEVELMRRRDRRDSRRGGRRDIDDEDFDEELEDLMRRRRDRRRGGRRDVDDDESDSYDEELDELMRRRNERRRGGSRRDMQDADDEFEDDLEDLIRRRRQHRRGGRRDVDSDDDDMELVRRRGRGGRRDVEDDDEDRCPPFCGDDDDVELMRRRGRRGGRRDAEDGDEEDEIEDLFRRGSRNRRRSGRRDATDDEDDVELMRRRRRGGRRDAEDDDSEDLFRRSDDYHMGSRRRGHNDRRNMRDHRGRRMDVDVDEFPTTTELTVGGSDDRGRPGVCLRVCFYEEPRCGNGWEARQMGDCWTCCRSENDNMDL